MSGSHIVVRVEDLWKTYRIHPPGTRSRWFNRRSAEFHALRDVNLEVEEGTVLGVVGRNGAGKSTLLKILSRITDPTRGRVTVHGRVASLLEVGTGFHPELTGRENVYLNAAIHGMKRRDVTARLPAIIDFAQVGDFLDEPVKRYSSGMYLRLAFSIAAHLDPDILIVDEVLAVGDAEFQARCLGHLRHLERSGRTIILVTHDLAVVRAHCRTAAWLEGGVVSAAGRTTEVLDLWSRSAAEPQARWVPPVHMNDALVLEEVVLRSHEGREGTTDLRADRPFSVVIRYAVSRSIPEGRLAVRISATDGRDVFGSADTDEREDINRSFERGRWESACPIPAHLLAPGIYRVSIGYPDSHGASAVAEGVLSFRIGRSLSLAARDGRRGLIAPLLHWQVLPRVGDVPVQGGPSEAPGQAPPGALRVASDD